MNRKSHDKFLTVKMSGTSKFLENLDVPDIFFFLFSIQLTQFFHFLTLRKKLIRECIKNIINVRRLL